MGTRGFVGFVIDGVEKISYNQYDSYPAGLGSEVLEWCARGVDEQVVAAVRALRVVDGKLAPTDAEIEKLIAYANLNVSERSLTDWYALLRETQGDLSRILEAGVLVDASDFALDSLFCEWGYLVNVDDGTLEAYKGFQTVPHARGRFAGRVHPSPNSGLSAAYQPVALLNAWDLDALPDVGTFVVRLDPDDDDDQ